jgi:hypothetical protein
VHALHLYTLNALSNLGRLCILDPISKKKLINCPCELGR